MQNTRSFVIISHIDHGKSTLADRFLELTGTVDKRKMQPQYLDMMDLEREKGITIKLQPVRMNYILNTIPYTLNLIDTPGHVDFNYEVSRSLAAVEGAILLVDAAKGIQAQTLSNLELAKTQGLVIIPVINKIDLLNARIEETSRELADVLGIDRADIIGISAKYGTNVEKVLMAVIEKVPPPQGNKDDPLRALIFDSKYDSYKGVVAFVRIVDGKIKKPTVHTQGEKIYLMGTKTESDLQEIGFFKPELTPAEELNAGEIGYIATGIKEPGKVRVGDTITIRGLQPDPLSGYREPKPMVFASIYPENPDDFDLLKTSLSKLKLQDASLTFEPETKKILGRGFKCGFLGVLHAEILTERLRREFRLNLVVSTPSVVYKMIDKNDKESLVFSAAEWPETLQIKEAQERWARLEVMTPQNYLGSLFGILENLKGKYIETKYFGLNKTLLIYEVPLREIITGFYDKLKGVSQGYASMNYEILEYRPADLVKLEILIAGKKEEAFSKIVPKDGAQQEGSHLVKKLKEVLPPQLFSVALQAQVGGKIIARETIRAKRRDVIAPLYGGDYTRKRKLLERQKRGKKKLEERGEIKIPAEVYLKMLG